MSQTRRRGICDAGAAWRMSGARDADSRPDTTSAEANIAAAEATLTVASGAFYGAAMAAYNFDTISGIVDHETYIVLLCLLIAVRGCRKVCSAHIGTHHDMTTAARLYDKFMVEAKNAIRRRGEVSTLHFKPAVELARLSLRAAADAVDAAKVANVIIVGDTAAETDDRAAKAYSLAASAAEARAAEALKAISEAVIAARVSREADFQITSASRVAAVTDAFVRTSACNWCVAVSDDDSCDLAAASALQCIKYGPPCGENGSYF